MSALIINITNKARFGGTATNVCHSPNASSISSTLLSLSPARAEQRPSLEPLCQSVTTGILLGSSGLGPNFSLNGAVPFLRVLQGTWEEEVGKEGGMGGPSATGGSSTWAPATLLEMTPSQLPASLTHLV